jgi:hypothetical protein
MKNYKFIKNVSTIAPIDLLLKEINNTSGKIVSANSDLRKNDLYSNFFEIWDRANFNYNSVLWENYYPDIHYKSDIISPLENLLNVHHIRSWVSKLNPGYCTPWHFDIDDHETEYLKLGQLKRFVITLSDTSPGHVFMLEDEYLHNYKSGDLFEWKNYKSFHSGMNSGITPKYLYNFLSYMSSSV